MSTNFSICTSLKRGRSATIGHNKKAMWSIHRKELQYCVVNIIIIRIFQTPETRVNSRLLVCASYKVSEWAMYTHFRNNIRHPSVNRIRSSPFMKFPTMLHSKKKLIHSGNSLCVVIVYVSNIACRWCNVVNSLSYEQSCTVRDVEL